MGVKNLWTILTPYCERKPFYELKGKTVAIDLAGWICESLNVVDYFVHPRQYLKNLFFRTCYLLLEGVIPVFVLEGTAPKLKERVINKRNELQFRGVKPRKNPPAQKSQSSSQNDPKGRTRFNHVLKHCENLLQCMGIQCVQGPGEAEAYCAFLNKIGLVDGVISQDSDCFAYGAIRVYRNFSVSTQGNAAAQGGAVDVYDMQKIKEFMDFGQNKIIVMALLCGCDYCPEGIEGVGKDSVVKLFAKYKDEEILKRIKLWRSIDGYYTSLEMKINDNNICSNCGHSGKTISHTKKGCSVCHTTIGCNESLWKEERLSIKAELALRKKALSNLDFPSQEIINEFLNDPKDIPTLDLKWRQPNLVKFVNKIGELLQWTEIYSFQKFLPLLTRWHVINNKINRPLSENISPVFIKKKRTLKGIPSYEIVWKDENSVFKCLIPDEQLKAYLDENPQGLEILWSTIEPIDLVEKSFPQIVEAFLATKQKKIKPTLKGSKRSREKKEYMQKSDSLQDLSALLEATEEISKNINKKNSKKENGLQKIDKYLTRKISTPFYKKVLMSSKKSSTPKEESSFLSNLDSENEGDFNFSEIIEAITSKQVAPLNKFAGKKLKYTENELNISKDDVALLHMKRNLSVASIKSPKKICLNDSLQSKENSMRRCRTLSDSFCIADEMHSIIYDEVQQTDHQSNHNVSFFFSNAFDDNDEFEKSVDFSFLKSIE